MLFLYQLSYSFVYHHDVLSINCYGFCFVVPAFVDVCNVHCKLKPPHFITSTRLLCTKPLSINPGMMVYTIRTTDGCAGAQVVCDTRVPLRLVGLTDQ
jgi:hypothetical protein